MLCSGHCVAPQAVEEIEEASNDKVVQQMDEMRKALMDMQTQLATERKVREEIQNALLTNQLTNQSTLLRTGTQASTLSVVSARSPTKDDAPMEPRPVAFKKSDRRLAMEYKERMIDGVIVTYLKERTCARMVTVCCLDVDCSYMVLLSGKKEFNTREILCSVANVTGAFPLTAHDKEIFPAAVVGMLEDETEMDRTLMVTYNDNNRKKIRFCMVMQTPEVRNNFKITLDVLSQSKRLPAQGIEEEVLSDSSETSDMVL
mmetsp:Transcript_6688/g.10720  ORF Transcript_6688/g.10720 Transcript_6688/m.10720 type:complete len:259 (+) Transcript_6688:106-882(+)